MEVVARVCKNILRNKMRMLDESDEAVYHKTIAKFYNLIFGTSEKSRYWWENVLKSEMLKRFAMRRKEGEALEEEVEGMKFEYYMKHIDARWLWERVDFFAGIKWTKEAKRKRTMLFEHNTVVTYTKEADSRVERGEGATVRCDICNETIAGEGAKEKETNVGSYIKETSLEGLRAFLTNNNERKEQEDQTNREKQKERGEERGKVGSYAEGDTFDEICRLHGTSGPCGEAIAEEQESESSSSAYAPMNLHQMIAEANDHHRFEGLQLSAKEKEARAKFKLRRHDIKKLVCTMLLLLFLLLLLIKWKPFYCRGLVSR